MISPCWIKVFIYLKIKSYWRQILNSTMDMNIKLHDLYICFWSLKILYSSFLASSPSNELWFLSSRIFSKAFLRKMCDFPAVRWTTVPLHPYAPTAPRMIKSCGIKCYPIRPSFLLNQCGTLEITLNTQSEMFKDNWHLLIGLMCAESNLGHLQLKFLTLTGASNQTRQHIQMLILI